MAVAMTTRYRGVMTPERVNVEDSTAPIANLSGTTFDSQAVWTLERLQTSASSGLTAEALNHSTIATSSAIASTSNTLNRRFLSIVFLRTSPSSALSPDTPIVKFNGLINVSRAVIVGTHGSSE
jgi:hypothetical protein